MARPVIPLLLVLLVVASPAAAAAQQAPSRPDPPPVPQTASPPATPATEPADDAPAGGKPAPFDADTLDAAASVIGLSFDGVERRLMLSGALENLRSFERLRAEPVGNDLPPVLVFSPLVAGVEADPWLPPEAPLVLPRVQRPDDLDQLAFWDIPHLAALIKSRQVSCVELAQVFLRRLHVLDETLHCVITYTEERALQQAEALDAELDAGHWRGPLHGLPWGAKDLLAVGGAPTTWGAKPYEHQVLDQDASVVRRLDAAGAVLIAKLSLGALAWGDVWFGGTTRNPWNPAQGSSGSSAGPAAATAAGGVVFAIGSETLGSIVSPSDRCGTTGLRPTFGRVGREGAMALSWSMDKLGPMTRSVADAALVFDAIVGPDGRDTAVVDQPWRRPGSTDVSGWRVGYLPDAFEASEHHVGVLDELRALGVELVPVDLPEAPVGDLLFVLSAEAASAFDDLTRDGRDDLLVRQVEQAWPNVFRTARLIPAVEYLRANRVRTRLCRQMAEVMEGVVAIVHPSFGSPALAITNLTGNPALVAPCGFREDGTPFSVTFTGRLYDEARLLALADAWQRSTAYHRAHPTVGPPVALASEPAPRAAAARDDLVADAVSRVDGDRLRADLTTLVGFGTRHTFSDTESDDRGIGAARRWLEARLDALPAARSGRLSVEARHHALPAGRRIPEPVDLVNVVAEIPGSDPGRVVVLSGHYDSRNSSPGDATGDAPGADDDGSGTVAVLEAARAISAALGETVPRATLRFACVAGEEQGLYGSRAMAAADREAGLDVAAMLTNDIVAGVEGSDGQPNRGRLRVFSEGVPSSDRAAPVVGSDADATSRQLARYVAERAAEYVPDLQVELVFRQDRFLRGGDHMAYNEQGWPAVRFTEAHEHFDRQHQDVRVEGGVAYGDTLDHIDVTLLAQVARLDVAVALSLALAPPAPTGVLVDVSGLSADTRLLWDDPGDPAVAGYRVRMRRTSAPTWERTLDVGRVFERVLPGVSKDDWLFAVEAYDADGRASSMVYPTPGR